MKIQVLGCHGSDGLLQGDDGSSACHTCGFLLNDVLLLDAGTVGNQLPLSAQLQIRHVVLSHLHFDHIKGLPTFADNLSEETKTSVVVAGIPEVIQGLRDYIFNTHVYPDFFTIPTLANPVLTSQPLHPGKAHRLSGLEITPILVNHTVPTAGFIIEDQSSAFVYSGDTYVTDALWDTARRIPQLKALFIECSYPNTMENLARVSRHLTPRLLAGELDKLQRPGVAVYAYHLKPVYKEQISRELTKLGIPNLGLLQEGQTIEF